MHRFKFFLFFMGFACMAEGQVTGLVIPDQSIEWRNQMGENYSPYDQKGYYAKAYLELQFNQKIMGDFYIGFELEGSDSNRTLSNGLNQKLRYFLTSKTNTNHYLLDWPLFGSDENVLNFSVSGESVKTIPLYFWVDPGQMVSPGVFSGNVMVHVYEGPFRLNSSPNKVASGSLTLRVQVSDKILISLGNDQFNSLMEFNVRFESLDKGQVIVYDAFVKSMVPYRLIVSSKGKGHLLHNMPKIKTKIPYSISLDHQLIQFNDQGKAIRSVEHDGSMATRQHKIKITLGDTFHAFKGEYTDRITLQAEKKN